MKKIEDWDWRDRWEKTRRLKEEINPVMETEECVECSEVFEVECQVDLEAKGQADLEAGTPDNQQVSRKKKQEEDLDCQLEVEETLNQQNSQGLEATLPRFRGNTAKARTRKKKSPRKTSED